MSVWSYTKPGNAKVVELVDTQGSGPCAREGVRVRVPPFAPSRYLALLLTLLAMGIGCTSTSPAEKILQRNMDIFDQAIQLVADAKGNQELAEENLRKFLAQNRDEIRALRTRGTQAMQKMPEAEQKSFAEYASKERIKRQTKLENLARTYKDPMGILSLARLAH